MQITNFMDKHNVQETLTNKKVETLSLLSLIFEKIIV